MFMSCPGPNKAMQADKIDLSCPLLAQMPRQINFAADQRR